MLFFLHIPKTAGSSLNYIIKNNFQSKAQEIRWHWTTWITQDELTQKLKEVDPYDKQLIHGHFVFGTHELLNQTDAKYLTFVRDPLKKAQSGYHHVKRDTRAKYHSDYIQKKMDDYLLDNRIFENDNGLVRRLSGIGNEIPYGQVSVHHFNLAIENINKNFLAVGITEHFDLSIELFRSLGVFKNVYYWKQNVSKKKTPDSNIKLSDAIREKFRDTNRFDYDLYSYCLDKFNKRTENLAFSQFWFNIRNKIYNMSLLPIKFSKKVYKLFDK